MELTNNLSIMNLDYHTVDDMDGESTIFEMEWEIFNLHNNYNTNGTLKPISDSTSEYNGKAYYDISMIYPESSKGKVDVLLLNYVRDDMNVQILVDDNDIPIEKETNNSRWVRIGTLKFHNAGKIATHL